MLYWPWRVYDSQIWGRYRNIGGVVLFQSFPGPGRSAWAVCLGQMEYHGARVGLCHILNRIHCSQLIWYYVIPSDGFSEKQSTLAKMEHGVRIQRPKLALDPLWAYYPSIIETLLAMIVALLSSSCSAISSLSLISRLAILLSVFWVGSSGFRGSKYPFLPKNHHHACSR